MAIAANLTVALGLESAQYRQGLDRARNQARGFSRQVSGSFQGLGRSVRGLVGGVAAFGAALGAQNVLQRTDQLIDLSRAVGGNFEQFQRLSFALEQSGVTATQTARALVTISQRTDDLREGTASTVRLFDALGISLEQLEGLTPEDQFRLVTDALRGIDDAAVRASIAADLFGSRISIALGPALSDSQANLDALANSINVISESDAAAIEAFNDNLEGLGQAVSTAVTQFGPFINVLSDVLLGVSRFIRETQGGLGALASFVTVVFARRFIPSIAGVAGAFGGLRTTIENLVIQQRINMLGAAYGREFGFIEAAAVRAGLALRSIGAGAQAAAVGATILRGALTGVLVVLRAIFSPINILITAATLLSVAFGDQLVNAFRIAVNFIVRQLNRLIGGIDRLLTFFGGDGITFRFEEWERAVAQTTDTIDEASLAAGNAAIAFEGFNDTVDGDAMAGVERLNDSFQQVGSTIQTSLRDTLVDAFRTGEVSARSFLDTVSNQILQVFASRITNSIIGNAFTPGTASLFGQILGFNQGGVVPRIPGSRSGVDSVPALLTPGETVTPAGEVPGGITVNFNVTGDVSSQTIRVIEENSLMVANIVEQTLEDRGRL